MRLTVKGYRTAVGVDVGGRWIKAAQLRRSLSGWRIEALAAFARMNPGQEIDAREVQYLRSILARQGFCGNDVVLAIPDSKVLPGILEVPPRNSGAPIEQIARMELSRMHKVPPNSFEVSFWDLPPSAHSRGRAQVMAVGCEHAGANALLDTFENAGLHVQVLDVRSCAIVRACQTLLAPADRVTAIIDIGWSSITVSLVCSGVVTYERTLHDAGIGSFIHRARKHMNLTDDVTEQLLSTVSLNDDPETRGSDSRGFEEFRRSLTRYFEGIANELQAPFSYTTTQYASSGVGRILLVGGGANIPGLPEYLASLINTPAAVVAPGDLAECSASVMSKSNDAAITPAIGLALFDEE
ncbi:MAG: pilus assembly protein PilM [Planctomycetota bacterium]|jgi:type IV pilus assembly protein PilM